MQHNILYSFRRCPFAIRARWALLSADINFHLREVDLKKKPVLLLQASPKGTVPVLITLKGEVIEESLEIMIWALKKDPHNLLRRNTRNEEKQIKLLIYQNDNHFKYHLDRFKYASRYDITKKDWHKDQAKIILYEWNNKIANCNKKFDSCWLVGQYESLADWALWPFVRQYSIADPSLLEEDKNLIYLENWLNYYLNHSLFKNLMVKSIPFLE
tara:strand:- start:237 stop:878 length:642 start_codon:yes stop_codon:yes gene_type:complete